ncbi:MAG: hypothetical protein LBJ00_07800, partial [Planctomycetaceae bacterium]|nr:hypothetical protein [Planctomycetaceae bacterium]
NHAELWDAVTGNITPIAVKHESFMRTQVELDLLQSESRFVVFRNNGGQIPPPAKEFAQTPITNDWSLEFPAGWGIDEPLTLKELKAWKDLDISPEGKAFSGTATYTTTFKVDENVAGKIILDLGEVDMVAEVFVNDQKVQTLWSKPYQTDIANFTQSGENKLRIEVTSTLFNRLIYDAGQPAEKRKTWTISGPNEKHQLHQTGLLGPVKLLTEK